MSDFSLKINDSSQTFKKFSLIKKRSYFSPSYLLLIIISTIMCLYAILTDKEPIHNIYWNYRNKVILIYFILHGVIIHIKGRALVKESLIVLKDIGIQLEKKYLNGKKEVQFVDISKLVDLIIHEGISPYDVRYMLALIIKGSDQLMIPFESFKMNLDQLKQILMKSRDLIRNSSEKLVTKMF